jgi:ABC-type phosphate transport system substrate-binding protein
MRAPTIVPAVLVATAGLLASTGARAADCSTLPNPVYATGSSAAKGVLGKTAAVLAAQSPSITVVYLSQGSCTGVSAVLSSQPMTGTVAAGNAPSIWDVNGNESKCDIPAPGVQADIGISDVFAETCQSLPNGLPSNIIDNLGPVQAMTFAVPTTSSEHAISAEAAFYVFGFGNESGVTPWTDETSLFVRSATSGTQQMIGTAISVPAAKWKGVSETGSSDVVTALINAGQGATPSSAIGILAADVADAHRDTLRELAYRHFGQNCGYLPDAAPNKFDKRNVRDGHYAIWGPIHLLKRTDIDVPNQPNIQKAIDYVTGNQDPPGLDLIAFEATNHVIPQCAMRVRRTLEMGPMTSTTPAKPCGCYYEYSANTATSCTSCQTLNECPAGWSCPIHQGMGFCEPP